MQWLTVNMVLRFMYQFGGFPERKDGMFMELSTVLLIQNNYFLAKRTRGKGFYLHWIRPKYDRNRITNRELNFIFTEV